MQDNIFLLGRVAVDSAWDKKYGSVLDGCLRVARGLLSSQHTEYLPLLQAGIYHAALL